MLAAKGEPHHDLVVMIATFSNIIYRIGGCLTGLLAMATVGGSLVHAAERERFDAGWRFARFGLQADGGKQAEPQGAEALGFADGAWRTLDLPHDWGIEGPFRIELEGGTGKLPWKGIGWYRKQFSLPATDKGKQIYLDIDGAMANAKIWCNGQYVGTWPYGYASFRMDLTPFVKAGDTNLVAVRLDTEAWDSRWYPGAGIYRHTWLVKSAPVHVGQWGVNVTTPDLTDAKGVAKLAVTVDNRGPSTAQAMASAEIFEVASDGQIGKRVALTKPVAVEVAAAGSSVANLAVEVANPKRWTTWDAGNGKPALYVARVSVAVAGKKVDSYDQRFGFRTIEFTARDGFKLNGKRLAIKGVCQHHDLGALGAALNDRALKRQFEVLKEMGCNAWRTSHNPPAPELLEIADRMGVLVWDEAFDCWKRGKRTNDYNKLYEAWHEKDLRALVRRDRSHPSVIIWSIGNEVMEQQDVVMTKHLVEIMKSEDPTRPVSNGYNNPNGGRASGACEALDIMGVNYFFNQQEKWDNDPRYAKKPTIGSETSSCVSSRGEYFFRDDAKAKPSGKDLGWQITSYDTEHPGWGCTPDKQFEVNHKWPHILGEFVWTGFDYLGEPTPYLSGDNTLLLNFRADPAKRAELERELKKLENAAPPSRSSYFGIIDLAGFPKDRYFLYQAEWRPDLPMAHILPHWNWPDRVGLVTPVHVYTSGDEAELFLNGQSLGRKKRGPNDFRLKWEDVKYQPGELKVVAYKNGKPWVKNSVRTTAAASKLGISVDRSVLKADGDDLAYITVRIEDQDGLTVPRSANPVTFTVDGAGVLLATDNGNAISFESFQSPVRKAFNGMALGVVRTKRGQSGNITVKVESAGLAPAKVTLKAR